MQHGNAHTASGRRSTVSQDWLRTPRLISSLLVKDYGIIMKVAFSQVQQRTWPWQARGELPAAGVPAGVTQGPAVALRHANAEAHHRQGRGASSHWCIRRHTEGRWSPYSKTLCNFYTENPNGSPTDPQRSPHQPTDRLHNSYDDVNFEAIQDKALFRNQFCNVFRLKTNAVKENKIKPQ